MAKKNVTQEEFTQEEVDVESLLIKIEKLEKENTELKRQIDSFNKVSSDNIRFTPAPSN